MKYLHIVAAVIFAPVLVAIYAVSLPLAYLIRYFFAVDETLPERLAEIEEEDRKLEIERRKSERKRKRKIQKDAEELRKMDRKFERLSQECEQLRKELESK